MLSNLVLNQENPLYFTVRACYGAVVPSGISEEGLSVSLSTPWGYDTNVFAGGGGVPQPNACDELSGSFFFSLPIGIYTESLAYFWSVNGNSYTSVALALPTVQVSTGSTFSPLKITLSQPSSVALGYPAQITPSVSGGVPFNAPLYPYQCTIDFGDGQNSTSPCSTWSHLYGNPGTYDVTATVKDAIGETSTATAQVIVT